MRGWIGVDLDGCLAHHERWEGLNTIGPPVPAMVARVKAWLLLGADVRIMTARANPENAGDDLAMALRTIDAWCEGIFGRTLPITHAKDFQMVELWDDRAIQVVKNTGIPVAGSVSEIGTI